MNMTAFLNRARRRVLLDPPEQAAVLEHCLETFSAGFNRGIDDVCKAVPAGEWQPLIYTISRRLVKDRSALEAGCWLAGAYRGRLEEQRHIVPLQQPHFNLHVRRCFCEEWEASAIADSVLQCAPSAVSPTLLVKALFVQGAHKKIADKLPAMIKLGKQAV
jgi:hypothetical protein